MSEERSERLSKVAKDLNVGLERVVDFLKSKGHKVDKNPNSKVSEVQYLLLAKEFGLDIKDKKEASNVSIGHKTNQNYVIDNQTSAASIKAITEDDIFVKRNVVETPITKDASSFAKIELKQPETIERPKIIVEGPKVLGKIDLSGGSKKSYNQKEPSKIAQPSLFDAPKPLEPIIPVVSEVEKPIEIPKVEPVLVEEKIVEKQFIQTEIPVVQEKFETIVSEQNKPIENPVIEIKDTQDTNEVNEIIQVNEYKSEISTSNIELTTLDIQSQNNSEVEDIELIKAKGETLGGLKVLGKIDLNDEKVVKRDFRDNRYKGNNNPPTSQNLQNRTGGNPQGGNPNTPKPAGTSGGPNNNNDRHKRKRIDKLPPKPGAYIPNPVGGAALNPPPIRPGYQPVRGNSPRPAGPPGQARPPFNKDAKPAPRAEITDKQIQEQIKNTLARLGGNKSGANRAKYRKDKRSAFAEAEEERQQQEKVDAGILKVTEFISASDLAGMMEKSVNEIIGMCMGLGMFISINQRLDAETIQLIAEEYGFKTQFISAEEEISVAEEVIDTADLLVDRPPIVTIMGHVDHGKTSLLDYIRKTNVTAKEAGGITQHIGAYDVVTEKGRKITFLDTPGHEAFTAMRARGAKVTDIVIIVVAADDGVMPQTKEALNHALVAGVPIIIAINKIDKPGANLDRIKEQLSVENVLVEDWGGKYQCEGISAKSGKGIPELLEKILLEADILELKANPNKSAVGTVIEAELDKGRGYVTTILVQAGTLEVGDIVLAGQHYGRVKAMTDHKSLKLKTAGPSKPVQILGLPGAPQAGDKFNVMKSEPEAREIANKREQILREQSMRTKKHITLDEIGRRLAIGNFKELKVIIKGDFDGSVQAISDSLLKLSTPEIQISIIHRGVGPISESDVLLASASDAVIIGFQVRPSLNAKKIADTEQIEIRLYSIIYDAINDIKDAMEGMLEPTFEEHIQGTAEVKEIFKIGKLYTIAGCLLIEGNIKRQNTQVRVVRSGIVQHTGKFSSLKRFKDDVSEVKYGQDCGIGVENYEAFEVGDLIEIFEKREVKRKL
ncbi:MAG: translation initiation factor IF-2 [Cytophagales bacterium]|nr:MAG: translation initiation factor IF-2 [Cytophagales bacterium]